MKHMIEWLDGMPADPAGRYGQVHLADWQGDLTEVAARLYGCVNAAPVVFANHIALPGTLLLCLITAAGGSSPGKWDADLQFLWRAVRGPLDDGQIGCAGHNRWWDLGSRRWRLVYDVAGNLPYPPADFAELLG